MGVCFEPGCVANAVSGAHLCSVHQSYTRRKKGDAPIRCYGCGERIRIGARWIVRAEGAYHSRAACLSGVGVVPRLGAEPMHATS